MRPLAVFLVVSLVAACGDANAPIAGLRLVAVTDGAHGGNQHFFFLPPLVPAPSVSGVFDGTGEPVVWICALEGMDCEFPLTAALTTGGTGPEGVFLVPEAELYLVSWDAGGAGVDRAKTYRIRVLLGSVELGHADVTDIGSSASRCFSASRKARSRSPSGP